MGSEMCIRDSRKSCLGDKPQSKHRRILYSGRHPWSSEMLPQPDTSQLPDLRSAQVQSAYRLAASRRTSILAERNGDAAVRGANSTKRRKTDDQHTKSSGSSGCDISAFPFHVCTVLGTRPCADNSTHNACGSDPEPGLGPVVSGNTFTLHGESNLSDRMQAMLSRVRLKQANTAFRSQQAGDCSGSNHTR